MNESHRQGKRTLRRQRQHAGGNAGGEAWGRKGPLKRLGEIDGAQGVRQQGFSTQHGLPLLQCAGIRESHLRGHHPRFLPDAVQKTGRRVADQGVVTIRRGQQQADEIRIGIRHGPDSLLPLATVCIAIDGLALGAAERSDKHLVLADGALKTDGFEGQVHERFRVRVEGIVGGRSRADQPHQLDVAFRCSSDRAIARKFDDVIVQVKCGPGPVVELRNEARRHLVDLRVEENVVSSRAQREGRRCVGGEQARLRVASIFFSKTF